MIVNQATVRPRAAALGAALLLAFAAATASGSGSAPSPPPRSVPPPNEAPASDEKQTPDSTLAKAARAAAEDLYAKGYAEAQEGKQLKKDGKTGDAKKKFGKAIKKFEAAVERDPGYYQAWNMLGYCSRNLGDLKRAFSAYEKCLSIKPDYDEAHEYLGEAYLQSGDLAKAKVELAWLRANDSKEADELAEKIDEAMKKGAGEKSSETGKGSSSPSGEGTGSR
ncbi:MAG TPA: tetratricopeptide repeat protein [Thermoanaerobaculia bacterium]